MKSQSDYDDVRRVCYYLFHNEPQQGMGINPSQELTAEQCKQLTGAIYKAIPETSTDCLDFVKFLCLEAGLIPAKWYTVEEIEKDHQWTNRISRHTSEQSVRCLFEECKAFVLSEKLICRIVEASHSSSIEELMLLLKFIRNHYGDLNNVMATREGVSQPLLHLLCRNIRLKKSAVKKLIEDIGLDPKAKDSKGRTLLMKLLPWQASYLHTTNGCYVIQGKGKTIVKDEKENRVVLMELTELLEYLVNTIGIDVNAQDDEGQSALMHCASLPWEQIESKSWRTIEGVFILMPKDICARSSKAPQWQAVCMRRLVGLGADLNLKDSTGKTLFELSPWVKRFFACTSNSHSYDESDEQVLLLRDYDIL